ncbi:MAG: hypothetical protein WCO00_18280, partial [Rhodospirillaceae bacterium]
MPLPRLVRWSSALVLTAFLSGLPAVSARAGEATLWDTVKSRTQQVFSLGSGAVRSLYAWVLGFGGESRLAEDLVAFSNKDLRDLELLVESAGYKLDDITIHMSGQTRTPADVSLNFLWQRTIDARHKAELREIIARDNALVDDDTRVIVGSLLDAAARAQKVPADRFQGHRIQIRLGQPPQVAFDFQTPTTGTDRTALPQRRGLAAMLPTMVSSAAAASPAADRLTPSALVVTEEADRSRLAAAGPEPVPVAPLAAPEPAKAEAPGPASPTAAVVPAPEPAPAAEALKAAEPVSEAKPPADIVGVSDAAKPQPPAPAAATEVAKPVEPAAAALPEPAKAEPAPPPAPAAEA